MSSFKNLVPLICFLFVPILLIGLFSFGDEIGIFLLFFTSTGFLFIFGVTREGSFKRRDFLLTIIILSTSLRVVLFYYSLSEEAFWINDYNNTPPFIEGDFGYFRGKVNTLLKGYYTSKIILPGELIATQGANGTFFCYALSVVVYLFTDQKDILECLRIVPLFHFSLNVLRIVIVYKVAQLLFREHSISRLSAAIIAFFPSLIYWDLVIYKESFLMTILLLGHYYLARIYCSRGVSLLDFSKLALIIALLCVDRLYFGVLLIGATLLMFFLKNARRISTALFSIKNVVVLLIGIGIFISFIMPQLPYIQSFSSGISNSGGIGIAKGSLGALVRIMLTPLPTKVTIYNSPGYLLAFGAWAHMVLIFFFLIGGKRLLSNDPRLGWLLGAVLGFFVLFAIVAPGGHRQRDNMIPLIAIVVSYGFFCKRVKRGKKISGLPAL